MCADIVNCKKCLFNSLQRNIHLIKMPDMCSRVSSPGVSMTFIRVEKDYTTHLTVNIDAQLNVKVYYKTKHLDFLQFTAPECESDIAWILDTVDAL